MYICIMSKQQQGGALPSSQGGLMMYTEANTGFEINPKMLVAFSVGVGVATIIMNSPRLSGMIF